MTIGEELEPAELVAVAGAGTCARVAYEAFLSAYRATGDASVGYGAQEDYLMWGEACQDWQSGRQSGP
jgi:hypothetical protein